MKNISAALDSYMKTRSVLLLITLVLFLTLLIFGHNAEAQDIPVTQQSTQDVKQYLTDKYIEIHDVVSTIEQTQDGPRGRLNIRGKIVPKAEIVGTDKKERSRAIAKAFLEEEADLFGITDMEEIREIGIYSGKGRDGEYTNINYRRYIDNLELGEMYIRLRVGPREKITRVNAELVPVPIELYEAVKKQTITEDKAIKTVERDLNSDGIEPKDIRILKIVKVAISSPPYVIWTVDANLKKGEGRWGYQIDAFTGEILKKGKIQVFTR